MLVKELIEKLREYPPDGELGCRIVGDHDKMVMVVESRELDPIFQFTGPFQRGFGPKV